MADKLDGVAIEPKPWQTGLAPVYIGAFLWVAFFDQVGRRALPLGGLMAAVGGVAAGSLAAYLLLFRTPALWGFRAARNLDGVAAATFGVRGARAIPTLLVAVGQIILFAVAVGYAVELTFQGLALGGLIDPRSLRRVPLGVRTVRSPLFLVTALVWAVATALVSLRFIRWIGYLMQFFPVFPALILGGGMMIWFPGLTVRTEYSGWQPDGALLAATLTFQWVFAFASVLGVMGADWGSGTTTERDVRVGGWVGMALAPAIVATLALTAIVGFQGTLARDRVEQVRAVGPRTSSVIAGGVVAPDLDVAEPTFRAALNRGIRPPALGAAMLMVYGLASLAPAVYAAYEFGRRLRAIGPGVSRVVWTMLGAGSAWFLIVGSDFERVELAVGVVGAMFAPVAGAIAADALRHRGRWPGPRANVNPAGLVAWVGGFLVGVLPSAGRGVDTRFLGVDPGALAQLEPAAPGAFAAAFALYLVVALVGGESRSVVPDQSDVAEVSI